MSKIIRLTRTTVKEYVPNPEYYDEGLTINQMAETDANADDLEILFEEAESDQVEWQIVDEKGQVVSDSREYTTRFENGYIIIEFKNNEESEWIEGRMSFNPHGLSLEQVNEQVEKLVKVRLGK